MPPVMDYSAELWAHFRQPRHAGALGGRDVMHGRATTPGSRAVLELQLRLGDGRVAEAGFRAYGCPATIAAGSWLADWLPGRSLAEAAALQSETLVAALQLPAVKRHCAVLAVDALQAALAEKANAAPAARSESRYEGMTK